MFVNGRNASHLAFAALAATIAIGVLSFDALAGGRGVRVRGYVRRDGTYVAPHTRTTPDGKPENNYGFPGNYNPNTADITGGDPATYLERYYSKQPRVGTAIAPSDAMPVQMGELPEGELARADEYCASIYGAGPGGGDCRARQRNGLARMLLADYSSLDRNEVARGARHCEGIYGDDRAGFYNCFNRQLFGIGEAPADFTGVDRHDVEGSRRHCESIYDDDRAGVANCLRFQATRLSGAAPSSDGIPAEEWQRSVRHCENIYGDDRGGERKCEEFQRSRLLEPLEVGGLPGAEWRRANSHCESIYGDDRGGARSCKVFQARSLRGTTMQPTSSERARHCEGIYGDDRGGYWRCASRP